MKVDSFYRMKFDIDGPTTKEVQPLLESLSQLQFIINP